MKTVTTLACISALVALFFFPAFAVFGMVLSLVLFVRGRVTHGIAMLVVVGVCGYLGMTLNLPYGDAAWRAIANTTRLAAQASSDEPTAAKFEVVSLQSQVAKASRGQSVCSWKLVIKNESPQVAVYDGVIEFQDASGAKLFEDRINPGATQAAPATEAVFTGSVSISSDNKVTRAIPKVSVIG